MDGLNKVLIYGNLGADPELRVTPGGQAVLKLRVATTESFLDKEGKRQERTEWHRVTVWGKRGEALARMLRKGARVLVEGRIQTTSYDKEGQKHYSTEIVANDVWLAPRAGETTQSPAANGAYARGAPAASATVEIPF